MRESDWSSDVCSSDLWNAVIPIDTKFRDASLVHIPPSIYAPGSRGTYAYETLLNHLDALERQRTQEVMP